MEKIYDLVVEWTRDEEAKYQATLIAKEVDMFGSASLENLKKEEPQRPRTGGSRSSSRGSKGSKGSKTSRSPDKTKKKEKKEDKGILKILKKFEIFLNWDIFSLNTFYHLCLLLE